MLLNPYETPIGMTPFEAFPKIPRLENNGVIITEKIDGTNAQILIDENGNMQAGSRSRWLYPGKTTDNYGFAAWVQEHEEELLKLGIGRHYGEWWGLGVNRGYGLAKKRFALFNTMRPHESLPACVSLVPVLYRGQYETDKLSAAVNGLKLYGSAAAPGFMRPEGVVLYFFQTRQTFKHIIEGDKPSKALRRADELLPEEVAA